MGAEAVDFEMSAGWLEAGLSYGEAERFVQCRVGQLGDLTAAGADQQADVMRNLGVGAAHKGVEAVDSMNEALLKQKVERAVDGGRFDRVVFGGEAVEKLVGLDGLVARPDQFQHTTTQRREACAVGITNPPGFIKCGADAGFVGCAMRHGGSLAKGACACNSAGLLLFVRYILL